MSHRHHNQEAPPRRSRSGLYAVAALAIALAVVACAVLAWPIVALLVDALRAQSAALGVVLVGLIGLVALAVVAALFAGVRIINAQARRLYLRGQREAVLDMRDSPVYIGDVRRGRYVQPIVDVTQQRAEALIEEARNSGLRSVTNYAPHASSSYAYEAPALSVSAGSAALSELGAPVAPPSLAKMLQCGWSTPDQWCVGIDQAGQPQRLVLNETGAVALSGVQGVGKTNTAAVVAAQTAAHGGYIFLGDPHAGDPQSLAARCEAFSGAVEKLATEPDDINRLILLVDRIYQQRCTDARLVREPVLLVIDELMELLVRRQLSDDSLTALAALSSGGRKKKINLLLIAQNWNGALIGKELVGKVRQLLTHSVVQRSSEETAKFLLPPSYAKQVFTLPRGQAIVFGSGFDAPTHTFIPGLTEADRQLAAGGRAPRSYRSFRSAPAQQPANTLSRSVPVVVAQRTNKDRIVAALHSSAWLTSLELAQQLKVDTKVIQTELKELVDAGLVARRDATGKREKYEYALPGQQRNTTALAA